MYPIGLASTRTGSSTGTVPIPARTLHDANGAPVVLGRAIGSGGEGTVYLIDGDVETVAKIYAEPPAPEQIAKLEAMIASSDDALRRVSAWPDRLVFDDTGAVGFTMPKLASQLPLHELFGPRRRQALFPDAHWTFLVHAALNVARAFEAMHERDIVVGDVNSNNVVIYRTSKTRFIDCDSVQIRRDGRLYRCNVGVPEYQPPELQSGSLTEGERRPEHDRFGLAVMIFQLLFVGKHPFAGILPPESAGDATIGANIAANRFFYGSDAAARGLRPPPGSLALGALPAPIGERFERAFLGAPADRPTAAEWRVALRDLEADAVTCDRSRRHRYVRGAACPWCELERSGLYFFVPRPDEQPRIDDSPWQRCSDADVERAWAQVAAVAAPPPPARDPVGTPPRLPPWKVALAACAAPFRDPAARAAHAARRARADQLGAAFRARHARWRELAANGPFVAERARLEALRSELLGQRAARERELAFAHAAQRQRDAVSFLAGFPIPRVPQVRGSLVTPSGPTTGIENRQMRDLAMYGITNASHVSVPSLRAVPHLRSWRFDVLMEWRMALDAQFAALPVRELDFTTRRAIEVRYARAREQAAADLMEGAERLRTIATEIVSERDALAASLPAEAAAAWQARAEANFSPVFSR